MAGEARPADAPKTQEKEDTWRLLIFLPGHMISYTGGMPYAESFPYPQAFGSGASYAQAMMVAGHSALEAMKITAKLDVYTNDDFVGIQIPATLTAVA